jgi:hypothetical protein
MGTEAEAVGSPSRAELLERVKSKLKNHDQVLWPAVSEKIQFLKALKIERARRDPDQEYLTVSHLDIDRALTNGAVVDVGQMAEPEPGWAVTIKGCACGGHVLTVMVYLCLENEAPLYITDFVLPES